MADALQQFVDRFVGMKTNRTLAKFTAAQDLGFVVIVKKNQLPGLHFPAGPDQRVPTQSVLR